jgi:lipopolysaccharide heptosyltransferase II
MNSLREIIESSPAAARLTMARDVTAQIPQPLGPARWDWTAVRKVLVIRLRSIGDTVLTTPGLLALRRFLPNATIDILLEDWVAPVLNGADFINEVITIPRNRKSARARVARQLRARHYDVVYNLHGGSTATFLTRATGAGHRVGFSHYRYARLHNQVAPPPTEIWKRPSLHSVEQQLALIGWTGVPVTDRPATQLPINAEALSAAEQKLLAKGFKGFAAGEPFALIHPTAAFETKQWATENFAQVCDLLTERGLTPVVIVAPKECSVIESLVQRAKAPVIGLSDLSLPQVTAVASRAKLFVGNDSGIAHIAAAAGAPCVVIFGSSNVAHWRPWTTNACEVVREELPCQPCPGYFCAEFEHPECIRRVPVERVVGAIDRILRSLKSEISNLTSEI